MAFILVVEDNADNRLLISLLLERQGHRVAIAIDAPSAHEAAAKEIPDLVLMDIQLPGSDGLTLTTELRLIAGLAKVPIVALTAQAMRGDEEKILAVCDGYIAKPIDTRKFGSQIQAFLQ